MRLSFGYDLSIVSAASRRCNAASCFQSVEPEKPPSALASFRLTTNTCPSDQLRACDLPPTADFIAEEAVDPTVLCSMNREEKRAFEEFQRLLQFREEPTSVGPAEILPHLLLGNERDARNVEGLAKLGVTNILNCAANTIHTGSDLYRPYGIRYEEFAAEDVEGYDIMQHYHRLASLADVVQSRGGRLFVHCFAGVNRSGALCLAYHSMVTGAPLLESAHQCKKARGRICTNVTFQEQVFKFARKRGLPLHRSLPPTSPGYVGASGAKHIGDVPGS